MSNSSRNFQLFLFHFLCRVGGAKNYADSDFVKPHESHAHLNLSHVLIADEPEPGRYK